MKTLRIALLGLVLSAGLVSGANAHEPRVGVNVQFGYPAYVAPPPVYYAPPVRYGPPAYYAPPPVVYVPPPFVRPYRSAGYYYDYDRGHHRGGHKHWRHHRHHR